MIDPNLKSALKSSYDVKAQERESLTIEGWKEKERDVFLSFLVNEDVKSLLEVGAGPGKDSLYFSSKGLLTMSVDLSPEMVELCKSKGLNAREMSFDHLDFSDSSYESIWAMNCLLHVPKKDLEDTLLEIKRVLKPSGLFFMGVYGGENSEGIWEDDFYEPKRFFSFYTDEDLKIILENHFKIEYFVVVPAETVGGKYHFQSWVLRKKG
ncbi:class I SAM-dependent methyltransferase [Cytobacillus sp. FJAT-54145]|uniref:Class I SAM-dependent methyltransferase n=1 Tax=Cytobacillus spartinae TaxID=3299023 RepID=A0ABW6K677_9BACI